MAVALLTGLALVAVVGIEALAVAMFLDWWLELPWGIRLLSLLAQAGLLGFLLWRLVAVPWRRQPDEDELALMVERARPEFQTRLIAAVQLGRPGAAPSGSSAGLVDALLRETEELARPFDFQQIVSTERLRRFGLMAVIVPVLALGGFAAGRSTCTDLLRRVFLSSVPVPRKTRVVLPEPRRTIGIGDSVLLEAYVRGMLPAQGRVEVKFPSRRLQQFPVERDRADVGHLGRRLDNVQESFTYRFLLGDAVSDTGEVRALARPGIATFECEQEFPAYTGLKTTRRSPGDLTLLAGSKVRLRATSTKDLRSAALTLVGMGGALPLEIMAPVPVPSAGSNTVPSGPRQIQGEFLVPARGLTGLQFQLLDTENMESRDPVVYRVDILPDRIPTIRLTYPERKEELVTRVATVLLGFEAGDDFQVAKVRLKYKADTVEGGAERSLELDLEGQKLSRLRRRYEWKLTETLPGIAEGSLIEYWLEAEDNNNTTGPGLGATDHQLARVVTEAEKRADLLNRAGDYLGSISDVAADQERLNRSLGQIIRTKAGLGGEGTPP